MKHAAGAGYRDVTRACKVRVEEEQARSARGTPPGVFLRHAKSVTVAAHKQTGNQTRQSATKEITDERTKGPKNSQVTGRCVESMPQQTRTESAPLARRPNGHAGVRVVWRLAAAAKRAAANVPAPGVAGSAKESGARVAGKAATRYRSRTCPKRPPKELFRFRHAGKVRPT